MSKNVPCNGCTACCQWGGNKDLRVTVTPQDVLQGGLVTIQVGRGVGVLATQKNGDCMYLDREKGCTIWERRPQACRQFDCRNILAAMDMQDPLMRIVIAATRLTEGH